MPGDADAGGAPRAPASLFGAPRAAPASEAFAFAPRGGGAGRHDLPSLWGGAAVGALPHGPALADAAPPPLLPPPSPSRGSPRAPGGGGRKGRGAPKEPKASSKGPCANCGVEKSILWRCHPLDNSVRLCNACGIYRRSTGRDRPVDGFFGRRIEGQAAHSAAQHAAPLGGSRPAQPAAAAAASRGRVITPAAEYRGRLAEEQRSWQLAQAGERDGGAAAGAATDAAQAQQALPLRLPQQPVAAADPALQAPLGATPFSTALHALLRKAGPPSVLPPPPPAAGGGWVPPCALAVPGGVALAGGASGASSPAGDTPRSARKRRMGDDGLPPLPPLLLGGGGGGTPSPLAGPKTA